MSSVYAVGDQVYSQQLVSEHAWELEGFAAVGLCAETGRRSLVEVVCTSMVAADCFRSTNQSEVDRSEAETR